MKLPWHNLWIFRHDSRWLPRAVWLYGRRWRGLASINAAILAFIGMATLIGLVVAPERIISCFFPLVLMIVGAINVFTMSRYKRWWMSSFYRHLKEQEFRVCLDCGYDLHGLPDAHVCPECSRPYEIAELADSWRDWIIDALDRRLIDPS